MKKKTFIELLKRRKCIFSKAMCWLTARINGPLPAVSPRQLDKGTVRSVEGTPQSSAK